MSAKMANNLCFCSNTGGRLPHFWHVGRGTENTVFMERDSKMDNGSGNKTARSSLASRELLQGFRIGKISLGQIICTVDETTCPFTWVLGELRSLCSVPLLSLSGSPKWPELTPGLLRSVNATPPWPFFSILSFETFTSMSFWHTLLFGR